MIFFSGFSLQNEHHFFEKYLRKNDFTIAGFSYGAIKAAEYAAIASQRIDTLQLFSPAFFQTKKSSFKRLQLSGFASDPNGYLDRFIDGCFSPCKRGEVNLKPGSAEELEELLEYVWDDALMKTILAKGIRIEVYLGMKDQIIDARSARDFFIAYATVTSVQHGNHFLQECK